jgi:uncharacterized protein involved in outer membrane biogenesis
MLKKITLGVAIVLVVLIVIAVIVMSSFLGTLVKTGIETIGPKITQVSIKVEKVDLSLLTGAADIKGLVVGNPEGYKAPQAISVGAAAVAINPFSVMSDKIVVRSVRLEAPEITFEGSPFTGNNLSTIMKNVNAATKSGGTESTSTAARPSGTTGKKLEVDDFWITGAKVNFNGEVLQLPEIHLTGLGKDKDGITALDLTRRVLDALTTATVKAVGSAVTDIGKGAGKAAVESINKKITSDLGGLLRKSTN